jgi:hypothetical protein
LVTTLFCVGYLITDKKIGKERQPLPYSIRFVPRCVNAASLSA